jgi:SAM-dependent methyltransferase
MSTADYASSDRDLVPAIDFDESGAHAALTQMAEADTPQALVALYGFFNPPQPAAQAADLFRIYSAACEVGHHIWPNQIRGLLRDKDVLDVGCGTTLYGAVIRAFGAKSYLGTDPRVSLRRNTFRNRAKRGDTRTDVTLGQVLRTIPNVAYEPVGAIEMENRFDLALLHTVTEHLMDIETAFAQIARSLRPGGRVWFLHDNYYSWTGHHMPPHSLGAYQPGDPEHEKYVDWRHVDYDAAADHPTRTNVNRIRLDDLRKVTERFFEIESWEEVRDRKAVLNRLTPEIRERLSQYTERELTTKHAICCGVKKAA